MIISGPFMAFLMILSGCMIYLLIYTLINIEDLDLRLKKKTSKSDFQKLEAEIKDLKDQIGLLSATHHVGLFGTVSVNEIQAAMDRANKKEDS